MNNNCKEEVHSSKLQLTFEEHNVFIKEENIECETSPAIDLFRVKTEPDELRHTNDDVQFPIETNLSFPTNYQTRLLQNASRIFHNNTQTTVSNEEYIVPDIIANDISNQTHTLVIKTENIKPLTGVHVYDNVIEYEENNGYIKDTKPVLTKKHVDSLKSCDFCEYKAKNAVHLILHTQLCHYKTEVAVNRSSNIEEGYIFCSHCKYRTRRKQCLIDHILSQHMAEVPLKNAPKVKSKKKKHISCFFCEKKFSTTVEKREHVTTAHSGIKLSCNCKRTHLKTHKFRNNEMMHLPCNLCEYKACSSYTLGSHMLEVHDKKYLIYMCDHCDTSFFNKNHLIGHFKRSHFKEESYNYTSDYNWATKKGKLRHQVTDDTFDYCRYLSKEWKNYTSRRYRTVHRTNEGQEYKCTICSFICLHKYKFNMHMRNHTSKRDNVRTDKPHSCNYCKFKSATDVDSHNHVKKKKMKNVKRYYCKLCDCKYISVGELVQHIKTHISERK